MNKYKNVELKNFTITPNEILDSSQLSIEARYLYLLLLKHCGVDEHCFPSQNKLAEEMDFSDRHIRNLLEELIKAGLIIKHRWGWNRANTYTVAWRLRRDRKSTSYIVGSLFPLHSGDNIPTKNTYLKAKNKRSVKGMKQLKDILIKKGVLK